MKEDVWIKRITYGELENHLCDMYVELTNGETYVTKDCPALSEGFPSTDSKTNAEYVIKNFKLLSAK